jgi:hypothetical protein
VHETCERLPRFDILPRMVRSPVEICFGTRPHRIFGNMAKVCLLMALPCGALARENAQALVHEVAVSAERTGAGNTLLVAARRARAAG